MKRVALTLALPLLVLVAACGDASTRGSSGDTALSVAATTRQVADFARQVGGDRVAVRNIIPANADPHDFEPRPSDARAVADADVAVQSGGDLDAWLSGLLDNAGGDAERVSLIDSVKTIEGGHHHEDEHDEEDTAHAEDEHGESGEEVDPHWWQDPTNVELAVKRIAAAFAAADPSGKGTYEANAARYVRELRRLDKDISSCLDTVPAERRKLVTNHDAFGYFARRYDIEVLGSIIPALSTNAQPSAGDLRRLVEAIRRERVTTIFAESALNQRLEKAVARDAGVEVSAALYGDTLGPDENGTYVQALRHDASIIAKGFGAQCALDAG